MIFWPLIRDMIETILPQKLAGTKCIAPTFLAHFNSVMDV